MKVCRQVSHFSDLLNHEKSSCVVQTRLVQPIAGSLDDSVYSTMVTRTCPYASSQSTNGCGPIWRAGVTLSAPILVLWQLTGQLQGPHSYSIAGEQVVPKCDVIHHPDRCHACTSARDSGRYLQAQKVDNHSRLVSRGAHKLDAYSNQLFSCSGNLGPGTSP